MILCHPWDLLDRLALMTRMNPRIQMDPMSPLILCNHWDHLVRMGHLAPKIHLIRMIQCNLMVPMNPCYRMDPKVPMVPCYH
jgi:hypothetical protein